MFYWGIQRKEMCNVKSLLKYWEIKQSCKDNALENLANSQEKNLCRSVFFNNVSGWSAAISFKRDSSTGGCYKFCENLENTFFIEKLRNTVSENRAQENLLH